MHIVAAYIRRGAWVHFARRCLSSSVASSCTYSGYIMGTDVSPNKGLFSLLDADSQACVYVMPGMMFSFLALWFGFFVCGYYEVVRLHFRLFYCKYCKFSACVFLAIFTCVRAFCTKTSARCQRVHSHCALSLHWVHSHSVIICAHSHCVVHIPFTYGRSLCNHMFVIFCQPRDHPRQISGYFGSLGPVDCDLQNQCPPYQAGFCNLWLR